MCACSIISRAESQPSHECMYACLKILSYLCSSGLDELLSQLYCDSGKIFSSSGEICAALVLTYCDACKQYIDDCMCAADPS